MSGAREPAAKGGPRGRRLARWWPPLLVFLAAFSTFAPALRHGFVDWDDDRNFLANEQYRGLTAEHLGWMLRSAHVGHWQPLSWITLALDWQWAGGGPATGPLPEADALRFARSVHRTSLFLHASTAVLVYALALGLLERTRTGRDASRRALRLTAAAAALLFALHPLRVESVVWATERRDVLSGFFLIAALLAWLRAAVPGGVRAGPYALALLLFTLSLAAKAWGITLPAVLLVLDAWPLRRWTRAGGALGTGRLVREKLPFAGLAAAAAGAALWAQRAGVDGRSALLDWGDHGLLQRLAQAAYGLVFYVQKTLWPSALSPLYELEVHVDATSARYLLSALAVSGGALALFLLRRRWPAGAAGALCYAIVVSPVLGFFQSGAQSAADRYTYLACLPFALLAAGGLAWLGRRLGGPVALATGALVCILLAGLSWKQTGVWRDSMALWTHVVEVQPQSYVAHYNLGAELHRAGRMDEALEQYRRSLDCLGGEANDQARLMVARIVGGDEAVAVLEEGLRVDPETWTLIQELDPLYRRRGRTAELAALWQAGIAADPNDYQGPLLYGDFLASVGRDDEAIEAWTRALAIHDGDPPLPDLHRGFLHARRAAAYQRKGRLKEAEDDWRRAVPLTGGSSEAALGLAECLIAQGRAAEARDWVERWLVVPPGASAEARAASQRARALEARIRSAGG